MRNDRIAHAAPASPPTRHRLPPSRRGVLAGAAATAALATSSAWGAESAPHGATRASSTAGELQPYASYWFPESLPSGEPEPGVFWRSLAEWTPDGDPDLPFNTATVPLAERFTPVPANETARRDQARVSTLAAFDHTSGNPSQGSPTADYYAYSQWAYLDELVFWGGSSYEGLIVAPNAPIVDAAHRNGVPVLGTIFLPPTAYDGKLRWTRELLRRDTSGRFPLADKLARVARVYGFDGWFLNAETEGGDAELAARMRDFVDQLRGGSDGPRVTWYDSMTEAGDIDWQNALNGHNDAFFRAANTMFLNFDWTASLLTSSARAAEELGRGRYELWAGVDVQSRGWNTPVSWDAVVPAEKPHVTSLGFYRSEWTWRSLPDGGRTPAAFHTRDNRFWTGPSHDPTTPGAGTGSWRAPATFVADRSTLETVPFATTFNAGHGLRWYEEGDVIGEGSWNHLGLQDQLPGRRWVVHTTGERPRIGFDFTDAWHGGGSLLVDGALQAAPTIELYQARLPLSAGTVVELAHRTDAESAAVEVEVALALEEPEAPGEPYDFVYVPAGSLPAGGRGWTSVTLRLDRLPRDLAGAHARCLGVRLTGDGAGGEQVRWRLGYLAVHESGSWEPPARPGTPRITASRVGDGGDAAELRLSWDRSPSAGAGGGSTVRHYELHQTLPGGGRRFLGGTCGTAYYVPELRRGGGEAATHVEVRAVDELFTSSAPAVTAFDW